MLLGRIALLLLLPELSGAPMPIGGRFCTVLCLNILEFCSGPRYLVVDFEDWAMYILSIVLPFGVGNLDEFIFIEVLYGKDLFGFEDEDTRSMAWF